MLFRFALKRIAFFALVIDTLLTNRIVLRQEPNVMILSENFICLPTGIEINSDVVVTP